MCIELALLQVTNSFTNYFGSSQFMENTEYSHLS